MSALVASVGTTNLKPCLVAPGVRFPMFPMRPKHGSPILSEDAAAQAVCLEGYHWQPKLNGDRAVLVKVDGELGLCSRHGSTYPTYVDLREWKRVLPDGSVLDGEVKDKRFYPFEAVRVGDEDLRHQCVTVRAKRAAMLSQMVGDMFIFSAVTPKRAVEMYRKYSGVHNALWEGLVRKELGSPYIPMGKMDSESNTWLKRRWRLG